MIKYVHKKGVFNMKMKGLMNKVNFAIIGLMVSCPAFAEVSRIADDSGLCNLIKKMQDVFKILRTLAFIGAAFYIAAWAWDFIAKGTEDKAMTTLKQKGTGLLIGFTLLFIIGIVLSAVLAAAGEGGALHCVNELTKGW